MRTNAITRRKIYLQHDTAYTLKALALAGAFYFFNHPKSPSISLQYLAIINT
ncbi:hypothetical protein EV13_1901 [Prochlorococcus sp. MIT 0702]|nr:hypothetical protein EV13_1901 [Prochlorococcus sp. MIT 0702]KGG34341.1 hypothetical protein EV14_1235 [Prochlorococcus sp. MIT 0703]